MTTNPNPEAIATVRRALEHGKYLTDTMRSMTPEKRFDEALSALDTLSAAQVPEENTAQAKREKEQHEFDASMKDTDNAAISITAHPLPWTGRAVYWDGAGVQFFDANGKPVLTEFIYHSPDTAALLLNTINAKAAPRSLHVAELSDDDLDALAKAKMDQKYVHLNAELGVPKMPENKCFCLACDPVSGEIGLECKAAPHLDDKSVADIPQATDIEQSSTVQVRYTDGSYAREVEDIPEAAPQVIGDVENHSAKLDNISMIAANRIVDIFGLKMVDVLLINQIIYTSLACEHAASDRLREALKTMVYETTHLSPQEDDGSHKCKISKQALDDARKALAAQPENDNSAAVDAREVLGDA